MTNPSILMNRRLPLIGLSFLSAGSLGAAAYFWNAQRTLVAENASLRARFVTTPDATPPAPPKLTAGAAKKEAPAEAAPAAGDRPQPTRTPEEEARRKEFETRMGALREKESQTRRVAKLSLLKTRLKLSPEQEEKAAAALQKAHDLRQAAREGFKPGEPPDFAKMQQMMKSESLAAEEIRAELTPEQQSEFDVVRQEERADRAEEQTNRQISEWQQYLKMSAEQKDAVFQVLSEQAMANDPEVQPDAKDFEEVRARMEASQAAQRESLAQVLDEAQMAIFDDLNTTRRETFGGAGGPGFGGPPRSFGGPRPGR
jgi:hypothetical protein